MEDWYYVSVEDIYSNGGKYLLQTVYADSPTDLIQSIYKEYNWLPWKFKTTKKNFFTSLENQKKFFNWLGKELGYNCMEDWYKISKQDILDHGGSALLKEGPIVQLIEYAYPDYHWLKWKFSKVPQGFWKKEQNQREYAEWLGKEIGYNHIEDWYNISEEDFVKHGGSSLLEMFHFSPSKLVVHLFPEHPWKEWKFNKVSDGVWNSMETVKYFLDELRNHLGFKEMEDWYRVTANDIIQFGGSGLLTKYNSSPALLLESVFPEYQWKRWKFGTSLWDPEDQNQLVEYVEWLGNQLQVKQLDDWYRVSVQQIQQVVPISSLRGSSLEVILRRAYPTHAWDNSQFSKGNKSKQRIMVNVIQEMFPNS